METIEGKAKAFCEKNICGIPADHKYIPKYSTRLAGGKFTNNDSGWGTGACRRTGVRLDPVGGDVRHLAGAPVGMGVDPLGEYAGHGNHFPGVKNVIANS